jgi:choice-of-anchor B domain-containing protein
MPLLLLLCFFALPLLGQGGNHRLNLLGNLAYPGDDLANIWGYRHPTTGVEYALVGTQAGLSIVSLANPAAPQEVALIPGRRSIWREIRTWDDKAYFVSEEGRDGITIVDLINLPNAAPYVRYNPRFPDGNGDFDTLFKVHTIHIDRTGLCYLSGSNLNSGGVLIFELRTDPWQPTYLGKTPAIYAHDCYAENGDVLYTADMFQGKVSVFDLQDPTNPVLLGDHPTPFAFTHHVWTTTDQRHILTTDERENAWVVSYDVSDPTDIRELDRWRDMDITGDSGVIPHNVHLLNDFAYVSYYTAGLIVLDAKRPGNLIEVARYDTYTLPGTRGFYGNWGVYPYLPSGRVLASDMQLGLFVFEPQLQRACWLEGMVRETGTNQPLSGVRLSFVGFNTVLEGTRGDGRFATGTPRAGSYALRLEKPGYQTKWLPIVLQNDSLTVVETTLDPLGTSFELLPASAFKVYPNPSQTYFELQWDQASVRDEVLLVYDALGRLQERCRLSAGSQNLQIGADWPRGWYWIQGLGRVEAVFKE